MKVWAALLLLQIFALADATKKASCNGWTLKAPDEGSFSCNPTGVTISMPGTRCTLGCEAGYRPQHEVLICSESGGWVPTNTPECQTDSTMTLVIVLSIVGSIVIIFGLSMLYARTSKRCRGKRRKLDEDDPESGTRKSLDTHTYYGQVKRLQRKRRIQMDRQKRITELKRRKEGTSDPSSRKSSVTPKSKNDTKRSSGGAHRKVSKHSSPSKRKRKEPKVPTKDPRKVKPRRLAKDKFRSTGSDARKRVKVKKERSNKKSSLLSKESSKKTSVAKTTTSSKNQPFKEVMMQLFCFPLRSRQKMAPKKRPVKKNDNSMALAPRVKDKIPKKSVQPVKEMKPRKKSITSSSSSSSLTSSESSSEETPSSNLKTVAPKTSNPAKIPPPRPPAPVFSIRAARAPTNGSFSSDDEVDQKVISSGYSSEGEKLKRNKVGNESENVRSPSSPQLDNDSTSNKRMEIMSYGPTEEEKETVNPYDHYPAALSYRKYQNFENDYRRTTGDYHPQYSNVKLIPLGGLKKKQNQIDKDSLNAQTKTESESGKPTKGGVKYISISDENASDGGEVTESKRKRNRRKRGERYEDPSARDKRRSSPDYHGRHSNKKSKIDKKAEGKAKAQNERKKEIGGERIIDNGKHNELRTSSQTGQKASNNRDKRPDKESAEKKK